MRKTLIALMFAAALPTVAMAMPEGAGPMGDHMDGSRHGGQMHGMHGKGPYSQLDLSREQREQIRKIMGEQMHERQQLVDKYLEKLSPADQKALKDEMAAKHKKAEADVRALLKPDQQKQFDEIQKKKAERRAEWAEFKAWKAQQAQKAQ
ncbi:MULTISPECIES: Spy/CpxP family protein refolding chaperone [Pseudomonas]|jgi:Spy/CpxP family protein refolding chaperone|uniref:LTXXQ domain protein n=1 Tax=Pseudomonas fluorescens TaxID=294 RepID=A0A166PD36_PSEFL|nr:MULTISPECIES: pilus assembly protein [Pseudomonas]EJM64541.1 P pilus assembly/Cpx signaling pathway, periplasmic inhibitor/zinc-resistance associated protein [Pseudomonas sp. GM50]EJN19027.1 P pilus assembly/Cpx signaling pathway, periplasmic inhibitor/zinc-resistance associated protein [Pseudomonas sp. GM79]KZN18785.1 LTXXQ domain protein [Pseudomonas fluorescens]MBV7492727.1 LTXXQ domain protein [Pseudomonas sp. PDM24]